MNVKSIKDFKGKYRGKKVLCRVDFNVPTDKKTGKITDDRRIRESKPTIDFIRNEGGIAVLMSHFGRPEGEWLPDFTMAPVAERASTVLGCKVAFAKDCVGPEAEKVVAAAKPGDVVLLENVRFHAGEPKNDPEFAKQLAKNGDFYVNDAFGTAHRAHASTAGVAAFFKGKAAAGFLMQKELDFLVGALTKPAHPFVAVMGGAKISGKIDVIRALLPKVDVLLIGGGMSYTFYKAMGLEIGKSLLEADKIDLASKLLEEVMKYPKLKFYLPMDCVIASECAAGAKTSVVSRDRIPADQQALDIGPETRKLYAQIVEGAKLVVWNGPMGVFEVEPFAAGTFGVAEALAAATAKGATTIIGGGDSALAIEKAGLASKVSHVSTGGGASLDLLGGKVLPGVDALAKA
jgi:phosphoglycerate kinase